MRVRFVVLLVAAGAATAADWSPRRAAEYLDARQEKWFAWPTATASGSPCVSCHTGMTYLMARPLLRRSLAETKATTYETGLLGALRGRVARTTPKELFPKNNENFARQGAGVESIFAALFLAGEDPQAKTMGTDAAAAFERMWSQQRPDGGFDWFSLELDPWEMPASAFYGASLAAMAAGSAPAEYRGRPEVREHISRLTGYLKKEYAGQPLHHRLMALWASAKLPDAVDAAARRSTLEEIWRAQQPDGSWPMERLGPWKEQPKAPRALGNDSYATAFTTVVLQQAGVKSSDARLRRALDWLQARQDPAGYWDGESMNKVFPADSMMLLFMRDAATAYASMALVEAGRSGKP